MSQVTVPLWFAAAIVVIGGICTFALATADPAVTFLTPNLKFVLGAVNVGVTILAAFLNIKRTAA